MSTYQFLAFSILLTFGSVSGLTCYGCPDGTCTGVFKKIDCAKTGSAFANAVNSLIPQMCIKAVGKLKNGESYTAKGCSVNVGEGGCNALLSLIHPSNIATTKCFTCNTDLCNYSSKSKASLSLLLISSVTILVYNVCNKLL